MQNAVASKGEKHYGSGELKTGSEAEGSEDMHALPIAAK